MKWEYTKGYSLETLELDEYGRDGWELISVCVLNPIVAYYFKRPLIEEVPEDVLKEILK